MRFCPMPPVKVPGADGGKKKKEMNGIAVFLIIALAAILRGEENKWQ